MIEIMIKQGVIQKMIETFDFLYLYLSNGRWSLMLLYDIYRLIKLGYYYN